MLTEAEFVEDPGPQIHPGLRLSDLKRIGGHDGGQGITHSEYTGTVLIGLIGGNTDVRSLGVRWDRDEEFRDPRRKHDEL